MHASLSASEWTTRVAGFQTLRGVINVSTSYADHVTDILRLRYLDSGIENCLRDTRSVVVKECCVTIAFIAQQYQYKVKWWEGYYQAPGQVQGPNSKFNSNSPKTYLTDINFLSVPNSKFYDRTSVLCPMSKLHLNISLLRSKYSISI